LAQSLPQIGYACALILTLRPLLLERFAPFVACRLDRDFDPVDFAVHRGVWADMVVSLG